MRPSDPIFLDESARFPGPTPLAYGQVVKLRTQLFAKVVSILLSAEESRDVDLQSTVAGHGDDAECKMPEDGKVDYIIFPGVACAARARVSCQRLEQGTREQAFYRAKIRTAEFCFAKILPQTTTLPEAMLAGPNPMMTIDDNEFMF